MREEVLKEFFQGKITGRELANDCVNAVQRDGPLLSHQQIINLDEDFEISPDHLVKICDAVLKGDLASEELETIGFCLAASDSFHWDNDTSQGVLVAKTVFDWSAPEINFPLTLENVTRFRERLVAGNEIPL